jgi:hypothetical protein
MFEYQVRRLNVENFKEMVKPGMLLCDKFQIWLVGLSLGEKESEYKKVQEVLFYKVGEITYSKSIWKNTVSKADYQCFKLWYQMCEEIIMKAPIDSGLLDIRAVDSTNAELEGFLQDDVYITLGQVLTEQQVKQWITQLKLTGKLQGLRESKI